MSNWLDAKPERLYSLDCLRGLAALSVVFWHWQHFFFVGASPQNLDVAALPAFGIAQPLYTQGYLAVQLFFTLSGFIFYWLYAAPIAQGMIDFRRFAVLRLSRLYPLHLLTLAVVAIGQIWHRHELGGDFVYPYNDAYHFSLNALMASSWGLEKGYSFNAPTWSVSVEILLYGLFFVVCRVGFARLATAAILSGFGIVVAQKIYPPFSNGVICFFLGGIVAIVCSNVFSSPHRRFYTHCLILLSAALWLLALSAVYSWIDLSWMSTRLGQPIFSAIATWFPVLLLFPFTVLALACTEILYGPMGRRLAWLGDISYSSYLWHFPLQLFAATAASLMGYAPSIFYRPPLMSLFFLALIVVGLCSHRFFEMPAQRYLRANLLKPWKPAVSAA